MTRYLVTGGCGFVGSNIAATLLARDEKVVLQRPAIFRRGHWESRASPRLAPAGD
jgi:nucleoside-diphosphate-sugar epimerase